MSDSDPNVAVFHVSSEVTLSPVTALPFHIIAPSSSSISYESGASRIRFKEDGTYRFVFEGEIETTGGHGKKPTLLFDLTGVEPQYYELLEKSVPSDGFFTRSIIMPCNKKDGLKLHFRNADTTTVLAGSQLQIYRL